MSGTLAAIDRTPRRNDQPERRLHSFGMHYIAEVVLQPMLQNAVRNESQTTQNARARAKAQGIVAGWPDHQVFQSQHGTMCLLMIEFKTDAGVTSERQEAVHVKLRSLGIPVAVCRSIPDVYEALQSHSFLLHGNARNMAIEAQARLEGRHREAAVKKARRFGLGRKAAPTQGALAAMRRSLWAP